MHANAGRWTAGTVVSEATIKADPLNFDLDAWVKDGAVQEVAASGEAAPPPAPKPADSEVDILKQAENVLEQLTK